MHVSVLVAGETEVRPLLNVLQGLGIEEAWILRNDLGDRFIFDPVPDFVVGVLEGENLRPTAQPKSFSNEDVAARCGLASGRGVPVLIIAPPPIRASSPDPLFTVVSCPVNSGQALADHVWAFTATLAPRSAGKTPQPVEYRLKNVDEYLAQLDRLQRSSGTLGFELERLVGRILGDAGAAVVEREPYEISEHVDIAFTPSSGSSDVILLEVKAGHLHEKRIAEAEEELQRYVIERQAKYGMLLYHDVEGRPLRGHERTPLIFRMAVREFMEKLGTEPLTKVIGDAVAEAVGRM